MNLVDFYFLTILSVLFVSNSALPARKEAKSDKYKIICYYTNWAQYRNEQAAFFPENIDPQLCTHIIFSFAKINEDFLLSTFEWNDDSTEWSTGMYQRMVDLKKKNTQLKIMLAVGGWNHGSLSFSVMSSDENKRKIFVEKAVAFLLKRGFDGLDLDWEFPASRDTEDRPEDKKHFTHLCKDLSIAFEPHGLLLSAAVSVGVKVMNVAYEMNDFHRYLDFVGLMSYDLRGSWDNVTGHNAPLYRHEFDKEDMFYVDGPLKTWIKSVPKEKLIMGIPAYGRSFKLREGFESCPLIDTPSAGAGTKGKYSKENGFLTYYEVCENLKESNWTYVWSEQQKVPYAYSNEAMTNGNMEWVAFDDVRSVEEKCKYVKEKSLAGVMVWSLDMDDFSGKFCNQGEYPLLKTINHHLNSKFDIDQLPNASVLWSFNGDVEKPKQESDFFNITQLNNDETISTYLTSINIFELKNGNVLQIYKFCQCKNGVHKINTKKLFDIDEKHSFLIDCNLKRVYLDESEMPAKNKKKITPFTKPADSSDGDKSTARKKWWWYLFNSATSDFSQTNKNHFFLIAFLVILFHF